MENIELAGFAFGLTLAFAFIIYIGYIWRKTAIKKAEDEAQRRYKEDLERARVARAKAREERNGFFRQAQPAVTTVNTEAIARKYNATTPARPATTVSRTTVVNNDSDDLLTAMILQNALNSNSDVTAGTVTWEDNRPTITPTVIEPEPVRESYSSSYSSSSSSDDSSSRSSYSSSYSSSSSDSSYSSSSSSSDYSSSSSDSGSSSSSSD
jgi:hypothetical protein